MRGVSYVAKRAPIPQRVHGFEVSLSLDLEYAWTPLSLSLSIDHNMEGLRQTALSPQVSTCGVHAWVGQIVTCFAYESSP